MKKDYLFPAWCVFLGLCFGFMILLFYMGTNQKEVETRPDIEICYGVVEQRGDLYGAFSPDGDFVATDPNEFKPGDKVLTTIIYNPNNDICDDIIKITRKKWSNPLFSFMYRRTYVLVVRARLHSSKALNCPGAGQIAQKEFFLWLF